MLPFDPLLPRVPWTLIGAVILSAVVTRRYLQRELEILRLEVGVEKKKREADRAGRIRAETSLRKMVLGGSKAETSEYTNLDSFAHTNHDDESLSEGASQLQIAGRGAMELSPIGVIRSCFRKRFGTPRQGSVVTGGRGSLKLYAQNNPLMSCSNLEEFSHVWLIYVFHENTNLARKPGSNSGVKSKVRPPRLGGEKVGLFATRTPHRPNAIGLSLVKLDRVHEGVLHLSGLDLIHGTPVLDVKPYIPTADSVPADHVRQAEWLSDPVVKPNSDCICLPEARSQLEYFVRDLEFYDSYAEAWGAIREVLLNDVRSLHMRETAADATLHFDNVLLSFRCRQDALVEVTAAELCKVPKPGGGE